MLTQQQYTADVIPVYSVPLTDEWYVDKADGQHYSCCLLPDLSSHAPITLQPTLDLYYQSK